MEGTQETKEMTSEHWRERMAHASTRNGEIAATRTREFDDSVTLPFPVVDDAGWFPGRWCSICRRNDKSIAPPVGWPCSAMAPILIRTLSRASMLAGHLLSFLCSFHFYKLPFHSLSHSCPIKPETLNTQIKASNGNKRGLRLAKLRPKKHVFNHVIILGRKYKCMLIIWISG